MAEISFTPTKSQRINLSFAYLAYSGEQIEGKTSLEEKEILALINKTMPKISVLCNESQQTDWDIVWGPAVYTFPLTFLQDNMMFVVKQRSQPDNYVVAIRGTNGMSIWNWLEEDFRVLQKVDWPVPANKPIKGTPKISEATHIGIEALLEKMIPKANMPGDNQSIKTFLSSVVQAGPAKINFTGHSLAGALAPTLALWFKQYQSIADNWDPSGNAHITTTPFAGATAGNSDFSEYFNAQLGSVCDRIHNTLDIVPHAWEQDTLKTMANLYTDAGIHMSVAEKVLLDVILLTVHDYKQVNNSLKFSWDIQPEWGGKSLKTYLKQAGVQHIASYPMMLGVPELIKLIKYKEN